MTRATAGIVALLAGFAVMGLELTAVRILAPHFGDSAQVWTNVIGVMLVALAAGAWLGGRLAEGQHGPRRLAGLFTAAGLLTALVPLFAPILGAWLLPQSIPLDNAMAALIRGSLAATLLLFAPPVALVGCMTPMLVAALVESGTSVGRASGLVASASTAGSLLGTFAATHLLVPEIGSRATIWFCAALVLLCAALLAPAWWRAAASVAPLALVLGPWGPLRDASAGQELLAEVESSYQYLQVVREDIDGVETTSLKINEGLDSFHSIALESSAFTGGRYYDYHAVVPFLAGDGVVPDPLRVLSLGAAAGTFARLFAAAFPGAVVDGVEIDPEVVRLGDELFGGRRAAGAVYAGLDARVFVERAQAEYDVVLVDTYERQIYVPAHIASREFFSAVERCLRSGGVVSVNSGGRTFDDPVVLALSRTMASVFGECWAFRVPSSRNFMLLARKAEKLDPFVLRPELSAVPQLHGVLTEATFRGAWRRIEPGEPVLEDDRPLLDTLQERSLTAQLGFEGLTPMGGDSDPEAVADRVTALLVEAKDYDGALDVLREARAPTARLRLLAGDVRWFLHDVPGAELEYQAGLDLAGGAELRSFAERKLAAASDEIARRRFAEAADVANGNGWFAAIVALAMAVVLWLALRLAKPAPPVPDPARA